MQFLKTDAYGTMPPLLETPALWGISDAMLRTDDGFLSVLMMKKIKNHRVPRTDGERNKERNKEKNHLLLLHANGQEPYRFPLLVTKNLVDSA